MAAAGIGGIIAVRNGGILVSAADFIGGHILDDGIGSLRHIPRYLSGRGAGVRDRDGFCGAVGLCGVFHGGGKGVFQRGAGNSVRADLNLIGHSGGTACRNDNHVIQERAAGDCHTADHCQARIHDILKEESLCLGGTQVSDGDRVGDSIAGGGGLVVHSLGDLNRAQAGDGPVDVAGAGGGRALPVIVAVVVDQLGHHPEQSGERGSAHKGWLGCLGRLVFPGTRKHVVLQVHDDVVIGSVLDLDVVGQRDDRVLREDSVPVQRVPEQVLILLVVGVVVAGRTVDWQIHRLLARLFQRQRDVLQGDRRAVDRRVADLGFGGQGVDDVQAVHVDAVLVGHGDGVGNKADVGSVGLPEAAVALGDRQGDVSGVPGGKDQRQHRAGRGQNGGFFGGSRHVIIAVDDLVPLGDVDRLAHSAASSLGRLELVALGVPPLHGVAGGGRRLPPHGVEGGVGVERHLVSGTPVRRGGVRVSAPAQELVTAALQGSLVLDDNIGTWSNRYLGGCGAAGVPVAVIGQGNQISGEIQLQLGAGPGQDGGIRALAGVIGVAFKNLIRLRCAHYVAHGAAAGILANDIVVFIVPDDLILRALFPAGIEMLGCYFRCVKITLLGPAIFIGVPCLGSSFWRGPANLAIIIHK